MKAHNIRGGSMARFLSQYRVRQAVAVDSNQCACRENALEKLKSGMLPESGK
jgi:hypothetical protein